MVLFFHSGTGFRIPSSNRVARINEGVLTDLPLNSHRSAIDVMGCPSLQMGHYSVQIYSLGLRPWTNTKTNSVTC